MESGTNKSPEADPADGEDIPSDFFDDFNKEEFMEGLSVIDSWDDEGGKRRSLRIDAEAVESVKDLRELIDNKEDAKLQRQRRSTSSNRLDDVIKPGSRRDPNKTNEAIKRDKEEKVKKYLAKHLESSNDLCPPGTELEYFNENQSKKKPKAANEESDWEPSPLATHHSPDWNEHRSLQSMNYHTSRQSDRRSRYYERRSPRRTPRRSPRRSPRWSPRRSPRWSPRRSPHRSPRDFHHNSQRHLTSYVQRGTVKKYSPQRRHFEKAHSPRVRLRRDSPKRRSPRLSRSPRRNIRSRSPISYRVRETRQARTRTPTRDSFLYPKDSELSSSQPYCNETSSFQLQGQYAAGLAPSMEYSNTTMGYSYPQDPSTSGFTASYSYGTQLQQIPPTPLPVPAPTFDQPVPPMPASPMKISSLPATAAQELPTKTPYDALAQLVAEGKISKADYLKLAPNKGATNQMDNKARVVVLSRCYQAMEKLTKLLLPNRLLINNNLSGPDPKRIAPKFCSPLKRQAAVDFHFTKADASNTAQQNKILIDSVISTIGLDKVVWRPQKKIPKNMKDAAVQTTTPYCEVCKIRESTSSSEAATWVDAEHFCATVHTQVVEQDLISSKTVFNPSGSASDSAPISIAHLTPAQLVSQLAARAKSLKQTEPTPSAIQFTRRPPNNYFDGYDGRGGHQYNNFNYRYQ